MGNTQSRPTTTVAEIRDTYGKSKLFITGDMRDYYVTVRSTSEKLNFIWRGIAEKCNKHSINGRAYVEWCFQSEYPAYPLPYKFANLHKIGQYLAAGCPDVQFIQQKLKLELMLLRMGRIEEYEDPIQYLLDPVNAFDPLFKYTIAKNLKRQDDLPAAILTQAKKQAFCQPVFADRFTTILPKEVFDVWI